MTSDPPQVCRARITHHNLRIGSVEVHRSDRSGLVRVIDPGGKGRSWRDDGESEEEKCCRKAHGILVGVELFLSTLPATFKSFARAACRPSVENAQIASICRPWEGKWRYTPAAGLLGEAPMHLGDATASDRGVAGCAGDAADGEREAGVCAIDAAVVPLEVRVSARDGTTSSRDAEWLPGDAGGVSRDAVGLARDAEVVSRVKKQCFQGCGRPLPAHGRAFRSARKTFPDKSAAVSRE